MTPLDWSFMTIAPVLALAGLALLFTAWKRPGRPRALLAGWALVAAGLVTAGFGNADRGVAQICAIAILVVTVWFGVELVQGIKAPRARERAGPSPPRKQVRVGDALSTGLSGFWTFLICGPIAGGIAIFASAGLFRLLRPENGNPATAAVIAVMNSVILWAILSTVLLIEPRGGRRSVYAGIGLMAAAIAAFV